MENNVKWRKFDIKNVDILESQYKSDATESEEIEVRVNENDIYKAIYNFENNSLVAIAEKSGDEWKAYSLSDLLILSEESNFLDEDYIVTEWRPIVDVQKIIEELQGTCNSLKSACETMGLEDENELTSDELSLIDMEIFLCDECGWWCEVSEQSSDGENCQDCNDEDED